jgi:hypothetical protein
LVRLSSKLSDGLGFFRLHEQGFGAPVFMVDEQARIAPDPESLASDVGKPGFTEDAGQVVFVPNGLVAMVLCERR